MEQSVAIRSYPACAVSDRLAQSAARIARRQLQDQTSIYVDVSGWVVLQEVSRKPLDRKAVDRRGRRLARKLNFSRARLAGLNLPLSDRRARH